MDNNNNESSNNAKDKKNDDFVPPDLSKLVSDESSDEAKKNANFNLLDEIIASADEEGVTDETPGGDTISFDSVDSSAFEDDEEKQEHETAIVTGEDRNIIDLNDIMNPENQSDESQGFFYRLNKILSPISKKLPQSMQRVFAPVVMAFLLVVIVGGAAGIVYAVSAKGTPPDTANVMTSTDDIKAYTGDTTAPAVIADTTDETQVAADTGTSTEDTSETISPTESSTEPEIKEFYNYLTGMACTEEASRRRPIAIMINNVYDAMPNVGISNAEVVYECVVEGGATRLMMLLHDYSKVPVFGSVRSAREYYVDFAQVHDAIYVHAGGSDQAYWEFRNRNIDRLDGVNMSFPKTFFRDAQRRKTMAMEHTLMATGEGIKIGIESMKYRETLRTDYKGTFNFAADTYVPNGWTANIVQLYYSASMKPEFNYNSEDKKYYRNQFKSAHIDGATGKQICFDNVIVLFVPENFTGDAKGHMAVDFIGSGTGYYISQGKYIQLRWKRDNHDSTVQLMEYNDDSIPLKINKGTTFISIFDANSTRSVAIG